MAATREIGPVMQKLREVLLGRRHMNPLRFPQVRIEWVKIFVCEADLEILMWCVSQSVS